MAAGPARPEPVFRNGRGRNTAADKTKGLVLGICGKEKEDDVPQFTSAGENFNKLVSGELREILNIPGPPLKAGKTQTVCGLHEGFSSTVVVGLGRKTAGADERENWHEGKENVRAGVAAGCRHVQDPEIPSVEVDPCGDARAQGVVLGLCEYDDLKRKKKVAVSVTLHGSGYQEAWQRGVPFASGQDLGCRLGEVSTNEMTPTRFSGITEKNLKSASSKTDVPIRPKPWIEEQEMGSFLSVARGSEEPPVFPELHYKGSRNASEPPLVFAGEGITFDSGGISLKAAADMDLMRADTGGAAAICSAIVSAAKLDLPFSVVVISAATLTGAMDVALGSGATGVFTSSSWLWNKLFEASIETGDRVWRMPLFEHYTTQIVGCQLADVNRIGKYRSAGARTAAAFQKESVTILSGRM
ncbi:cytosol aminopeptidase [Pontoporia blainvillei]|uniref:Cytosol aminopeptidase n=1 Tax=Pontoporia blainvillei TaxID=48723 RepID=A0ABX0SB24_PONBL|nr:cytosol aminopeptidase [Pontoporia blainvillei]